MADTKQNPTATERQLPQASSSIDDYFLQALVNMANDGVETGVTLMVGGLLITGFLVSGRRYFNEYLVSSISMTPDPDGSGAAAMKLFYESFGAVYSEERLADENRLPPSFVHLWKATIMHPSGSSIPTEGTMWWRGRISEVQGFIMGTMTRS